MNITLTEAYRALKPLDRSGEIELSVIESREPGAFEVMDINNCNRSIKNFEKCKLENSSLSEFVEYRSKVMKGFIDKVGEIFKDESRIVIRSLMQQQELQFERERSL